MSQKTGTGAKRRPTLADHVGAKAGRKLRARRNASQTWSGLGMMGVIGWSVVVPTLLGTGLGAWLDARHAGRQSWTLALLVAGLLLGCLNAWYWVAREERTIREERGGGDG